MPGSTDLRQRIESAKARKRRGRPLEFHSDIGDNETQTIQYRLADNYDFFLGHLRPLKDGSSVTMRLKDPRPIHNKMVAPRKDKLVVLNTYDHPELDAGAILVSVIGKGSCIVWPGKPKQSANLVLAGIPAKLANALLDTLQRLKD